MVCCRGPHIVRVRSEKLRQRICSIVGIHGEITEYLLSQHVRMKKHLSASRFVQLKYHCRKAVWSPTYAKRDYDTRLIQREVMSYRCANLNQKDKQWWPVMTGKICQQMCWFVDSYNTIPFIHSDFRFLFCLGMDNRLHLRSWFGHWRQQSDGLWIYLRSRWNSRRGLARNSPLQWVPRLLDSMGSRQVGGGGARADCWTAADHACAERDAAICKRRRREQRLLEFRHLANTRECRYRNSSYISREVV